MYVVFLAAIYILLDHVAASMMQQFPQGDGILDTKSQTNITLPPSTNISTPSNVLEVRCEGSRYGRDLNVASCRDVFNFMDRNNTQVVFSERHSGFYHDIPLPYRILGSELSFFFLRRGELVH